MWEASRRPTGTIAVHDGEVETNREVLGLTTVHSNMVG
jgi:hypothetical protein